MHTHYGTTGRVRQGQQPTVSDRSAEDNALFGLIRNADIRGHWINEATPAWFFCGLNAELFTRLRRLAALDRLRSEIEIRVDGKPVTLEEGLGKPGVVVRLTVPALRRQLVDDGEEPLPVMREVERILAEAITPGDGTFNRLRELAERRRLLHVAEELARRAADEHDDLAGLQNLVGAGQ
jgi:hypothetical protein